MSHRLKWCALAIALTSTSALAQVTPSFEIGTEVYQETYKETVDGQPFMKEQAIMIGVNGAVRLQFTNQDAVKFSARYAQGKSDYTGAFDGQPYGSLTSNGQDRYTYEFRGVYEATGPVSGHDLTTSLGLGYRNLTDRLDQSGPGGYKRESEYFYATLGLEAKYGLGASSWDVTPKIAYNHLIQGTQHSFIGGNDFQNRQNNGHGFELSAAVSRQLQNTQEIRLTPFYRYWKVRESEATPIGGGFAIVEPENKTNEFGLNLSYVF